MTNSASIPRHRPEDDATYVTVSDPVQHSEGMNKYTSYRVDVRGEIGVLPSSRDGSAEQVPSAGDSNPMFQSPHHSAVLRRYSDFVWLLERLGKERGGAILPPLPEKQAVARFSPEFVEERRYQLELFLRRVVVHPELYDAPCLVQFLRADDATFYAAKNNKTTVSGAVDAGQPYYDDYRPTEELPAPRAGAAFGGAPASPKKKKDGIKQWFAETKTSIQISTMGGVDLVQSPDDALFDEMDRYVTNLDSQMKNVLAQATALVRRGKELANGFYELGMAFNLLSQSESCGSPSSSNEAMDYLATALSKMGVTADELSAITAEQSDKEESNFEAMLRDYIRTIQSVKRALEKRSEKRLTYTTCIHEVQTKSMAVEKVRGLPGKEDKAYQAQASLVRSQEAAEAAREEFATVSQRILREMDRFKREKADDMRYTVLDYIEIQIQYNARMEKIWADLIPQLEQLSRNSDEAAAISAGGDHVHQA